MAPFVLQAHMWQIQGMVTLYTVHSILVLRLYGLYGSKRLVYLLLTFLCVAFAAEVYVLVAYAPNSISIDVGMHVGRACMVTDTSKTGFVW